MSDSSKKGDVSENNDEFWNLNEFLPEKPRPSGYVKRINPAVMAEVEISFGVPEQAAGKSIPIPTYSGSNNTDSAEPEDFYPESRFIKKCEIIRWPSHFSLYGNFIRDAKKYYTKTCLKAQYVYFFSYRSQYSELSHEQMCWYLYWRDMVKSGNYIKTGLSYIFLFIYELINIADITGKEKSLEYMLAVWKNYRNEFPRIDKYMAEWVTDFIIINKLTPNFSAVENFLSDIIKAASFKEFYLQSDFFEKLENVDLILKCFSKYDYTESKYYTESNKALFDSHMTSAIHALLKTDAFKIFLNTELEQSLPVKLKKETFIGAICSHQNKKRITIEYTAVFHNYALIKYITSAVKVIENSIRAHLKVKSRLNAGDFDEPARKVLDGYTAAYLKIPKPAVKTDIEEKQEPAYEFTPDINVAINIEKKSWDTTAHLVMLQSRDSEPEIAVLNNAAEPQEPLAVIVEKSHSDPVPVNNTMGGGMDALLNALCGYETEFLKCALKYTQDGQERDEIYREIAKANLTMTESIIDGINEKAMDIIGDIIFDTEEQGIISDYYAEIQVCAGILG